MFIPILDIIKLTLNLEESSIQSFKLVSSSDKTDTFSLTLNKRPVTCPNCKSFECITHDYRDKRIVHDVLKGRRGIIIYHKRRYICKKCRKIFDEPNPISSGNHRISNLTITNIMKELHRYTITYKEAGLSHGLSTTTVIKIFDSMIPEVKRIPLPEIIGIDEIHMPMVLYNSKFICVMMDIRTNQLIEVLPQRRKDYLRHYFEAIPKEERDNVKYFSCDMYDTYIWIANKYLKNAKICVDPFHVMEHVTKAFDEVRIEIEKQLKEKDGKARYLFNRFRWLLYDFKTKLDNEPKYNHVFGRYLNYRQILRLMLDYSETLETAFNLYSDYHYINSLATSENCEEKINQFISDCINSDIGAFIRLSETFMRYRKYIINSYDRVDGKRITNAAMESLNGRIDKLEAVANGFLNFDRFRIRALYCFNHNVKYTLHAVYSTNKIKQDKK